MDPDPGFALAPSKFIKCVKKNLKYKNWPLVIFCTKTHVLLIHSQAWIHIRKTDSDSEGHFLRIQIRSTVNNHTYEIWP